MRHPWRENSRLGREALKTAADKCADCLDQQQMFGLCNDEYICEANIGESLDLLDSSSTPATRHI
jgi:hypothetical protein